MATSAMSMESHHFDGALMSVNRLSIIRSSSCSGSGRTSPAPALITSASLQSFSESDTDSLSSSPHPALSSSFNNRVGTGRSIFDKYWTSPTHKKSLEKDADDEEEEALLKRLSTLQLPLADEEDDSDQRTCAIIHPATTASPKTNKISPSTTTGRSTEEQKSFDDTSINYSTPPSPARTQRRQILPTPPPPSVSSSLTVGLLSPRGWSSTSALLKGPPSQSCLRKSRYSSFSGIVSPENDASNDELKKENRTRVSFYSQVSVFEYHEQIQRSQKGWSNYFA